MNITCSMVYCNEETKTTNAQNMGECIQPIFLVPLYVKYVEYFDINAVRLPKTSLLMNKHDTFVIHSW